MVKVLTYKDIDRVEWNALVNASATGTWFQGPEAYSFYESLPDLFQPFVLGVASLQLPPKGKRGTAYLRLLPKGKRGTAYLRLLPKGKRGTAYLRLLPIGKRGTAYLRLLPKGKRGTAYLRLFPKRKRGYCARVFRKSMGGAYSR